MPKSRTSFKKGDPNNPRKVNPNSGRKKGTPNKITNDLRLHILNALNAVGGEAWFKDLARKNKRDMAGLVKAIIPRKLETGMDPEEAAAKIRQSLGAMESATIGEGSDE